ncbi:ubiquinol-cytochrome c reductase [Teredinibacter sp. KSP-S5-2]|uniref:ubiquinol-cytochrome c reductase n=1 Tax=Teredinibacter sp. KSP-S5-2 TaxID=3034506 RepID=UPI0029344EA0|nr:cytochrome b N-terminal domain-containing protein [Teredinibacter sp. KSP-S5-2]WNO08535.1 cytochrome b N-terminal domain-containing protein [Teredinibacter sp. KSP-S5-2]
MTNWLVGLWNWIDARMPVQRTWDTHMGKYYTPKNFNFWYFFGVLSILVLVNQLLTGIWLTMNYVPSAEEAFASVEFIMRDVPYGWIIRYLHSTGASAFFIVVYLHMFRGLMYGSYKNPRELVWIFGMFIYIALMGEAFLGYVLPWGQMSYWGAQVIVNLAGAIPYVGDALVEWVRGDYLISGATLNRFFALHVVALPIVLLALVVLHIIALHEVGSNNPDGVEIKKNKDENGVPLDGIPFHPYYTVHDLVGISVFLFVFLGVVFFAPEVNGFFLEHANFEEANNLKTPAHIAPVWYFTPFYAILRAITFDLGGVFTSKFLGVIAMGASLILLFFLPWLDRSPVKSIRYKGLFSQVALIVFAAAFVILGYLGLQSPTPGRTALSQICTFIYFAYFIGLPFWTKMEQTKPEPTRVQKKGLSKVLVFGGLALFLVLVIVPLKAVGASGGACGEVPCDHFEANLEDKESLQRGAKYFVNYCMGCHSARFSRYERVATDLDIPVDVAMENFIFSDQKIGDLMTIAMASEKSKVWFGATPPDLTLVARARSSDWLYTFLRNFYSDDSRPTGVNNKVFPNVGMPHVLMELQGLAECAAGEKLDSHGHVVRNELGESVMTSCGSLKVGDTKGSMTAEEFDSAIYDLVNFMTYVSEPVAMSRGRIGIYVFLFLSVLLVFTWLLNREYWKDVH